MAKQPGLGAVLTVDNSAGSAKTISNSVTNWEMATPRAVQETTGVDKFATERLLLLADFSITLNGVFDTTADRSHDVFSDVSSTSAARTTKVQPTSASVPYLQNECLFTDYQVSRADTGALTWQAPGVLSDGTVPTWTNA